MEKIQTTSIEFSKVKYFNAVDFSAYPENNLFFTVDTDKITDCFTFLYFKKKFLTCSLWHLRVGKFIKDG